MQLFVLKWLGRWSQNQMYQYLSPQKLNKNWLKVNPIIIINKGEKKFNNIHNLISNTTPLQVALARYNHLANYFPRSSVISPPTIATPQLETPESFGIPILMSASLCSTLELHLCRYSIVWWMNERLYCVRPQRDLPDAPHERHDCKHYHFFSSAIHLSPQ